MAGSSRFQGLIVSIASACLMSGVALSGCGGDAFQASDVVDAVTCGTCDDGYTCQSGECVEDACVPACGTAVCGMDPVCGTFGCGRCDDGYHCQSGQCLENVVSGEMVLIPAGSFWMGCNATVDSQCEGDESPYHEVTLSGYYIDKTEVTVDDYADCVTAGACTAPSTAKANYCNWEVSGKGNHPVNCVNWSQAGEYCTWAGKRLPTEAEWEKAARGTDGRKYPWGNEDATCEYAVMYDGTDYGCGTNSTWDVCSKSPAGDSPYGLCDMSGNVWEWVSDWYDFGYYTNSPASNPTGPVSGSDRVIRGGSFHYNFDYYLRASIRGYGSPSVDTDGLGFRCARPQSCVPACGTAVCGMDPVCGQSCGTCDDGYHCQSGQCLENVVSGEMVLIPAGSFWMGCNATVDSQCEVDESPYHEVTLSGYYIDKTEVTVDEYAACVTAGGCTAPSTASSYCNWEVSGKGNHPVNCVYWSQAGEYCTWAGKRLPTEAEWEKAARGTDGRKYPWGNEDATCEYAVMYDGTDNGCGTYSTWEVCGKSPAGDSPYGLCDMAGNLDEWVSDWYDSGYYTNSQASNPTGPVSGSYRVSRGGSFAGIDVYLRASFRDGYVNPSYYTGYLGFRCARDAL